MAIVAAICFWFLGNVFSEMEEGLKESFRWMVP
jgi:hypothetical protein